MWVNVHNSTGGTILTIDYGLKQVTSTTPLTFPGFNSMWADCAETGGATSDIVSGTYFTAATGTLAFGVISTRGAFVAQATGKVPAGMVPNGVLSFANLFSTNYDYMAPVYPPGAAPGPTPASGYIGFFADKGPNIVFSPVGYFLAGASLS